MEDNFIKINKWLYPISFLYGIGVHFRNKLFDWGILPSRSFDVPVISIGNITVGGTGKTPHTEYLIKLLRNENRIAVLSRGYRRKSKGFILSDTQMPASLIGDEPFQMKHKFPGISVAVDSDRCHGITQLCNTKDSPEPDLILLDDAYQHRYVKPGINILLINYYRLICNDALLPAGRLREPAKQKSRATIVIVTKCPDHIKPVEIRVLSKQLNLFPYQKLYFTSFRYKELVPVFNTYGKPNILLEDLHKKRRVLLITGIASPKQILLHLKNYTEEVESFAFGDHHDFTRKDMDELSIKFGRMNGNDKLIITTEKDAARLIGNSYLDESLKPFIYALPIEVCFLQNQEKQFNDYILGFIKKGRNKLVPSENTTE